MNNHVISTLKIIMNTRGISEYRLSQISGVPQSTINSLFLKNNVPSITTLELLCAGLNLSLVEFFTLMASYDQINPVNPDQLSLHDLMVEEVEIGDYGSPLFHIIETVKKLDATEMLVVKQLLDLIVNKNHT